MPVNSLVTPRTTLGRVPTIPTARTPEISAQDLAELTGVNEENLIMAVAEAVIHSVAQQEP